LNTRRNRTFRGNGLYFKEMVAGPGCTTCGAEHDEHVMQMNEVRHFASGWVQRGVVTVTGMIDEPGHSTGHLAVPFE
jgi:hypothetical protein